jgi:hypothetical protein
LHGRGDTAGLMARIEAMLLQNYQMKDNEFQSIYFLHEWLVTLAAKEA